ncbi:hypothetical protein O181_002031 [Austropuccinia psidii MF-1]|uniref:Tyrosinase copper-binding domain-containing protein n=1 Tax=Austropuccinia psidii MF-1 TaxID=1389203 RepID=A0A9Q3BB88_9BASI|nr:hypothetical protein [Austropuccinia psidii MF-1]
MTVSCSKKDEVDHLARDSLYKLLNNEADQKLKDAFDCATRRGSCDPSIPKLGIRREWGKLSKEERRSYIDAVLCLQSKPSITPSSEVPGAKSRYDDFVATHINQTLYIHGTANFLSWHRYFLRSFEKALQDECGYEGHQPYWAWEKYAQNPLNSPLLDGSEYSFGGNGEYQQPQVIPNVSRGCVTTGPFKKSTEFRCYSLLSSHYNPRCLKRDVSTAIAQRYTNTKEVVSLITKSPDLSTFQFTMQGRPDKGFFGVHGGGHFTISGDPGGDFFVSPGEPMFWVHHSMIDRVWWIWQNQELDERIMQVAGTLTMYNIPPSRKATLDDLIDLGYNAPAIPMRDMTSTTNNSLWYIYL